MLTEDARPKSLKEVKGQEKAVKFLKGWLNKYKENGTADAFLIHGQSGSGKTSIAHAIAGELGSDWGFKIVGSKECNVEQVRALREELGYSMLNQERWRVILVDEAHCMSKDAMNAFLSLLENLPQFRLVMFTTTEPMQFDLVWRSRCKMISLNTLDEDDIKACLLSAAGDRKVPDGVIEQITQTSAGNLRAAYHALEQHMLTVTVEEDETATTTEEMIPKLAEPIGKMVEQPNGTTTIKNEDGSKIVITPVFSKDAASAAPVKFTTRPGLRDGYIEVVFEGKPDEDIRRRLKAKGFRWNGKTKCWWGKSVGFPLVRELHACEPVETPAVIVNPTAPQDSLADTLHKPNPRADVLQAIVTSGYIRKKPRGIEIVPDSLSESFVLIHEGEKQSIGFPPFKTYSEAMAMRDKAYELADWTDTVENIMAIDGLADKLCDLAYPLDAAAAEAEPEPVLPIVAVEEPPKTGKKWKYWVRTAGDGEKWSTNAKEFDSEDEAKEAGNDLMMRWMAVTEVEVRPMEEEVVVAPAPVIEVVEEPVVVSNVVKMPSRREQLMARVAAIRARR